MTTISDVAQAAGVSVATVSRVVNGNSTVRADLRARVQRAVDDLGYFPNAQARSLRRQASEVIALVLPDIENPFFTSMARGVEDIAATAGYSVMLCNSDERVEKEATYLDIAAAQNVAGVVLVPTSSSSDVDTFVTRGIPLVAADRISTRQVDAVITDDRENGRIATQLLLDAGYKTIGCITGPRDIQLSLDRSEGWRVAMQDSGLDLDSLFRHTSFRPEGGRVTLAKLMDGHPELDAVLLTNNLLGIGALQTVVDRNVEDFGIATVGEIADTFLPRPVAQVRLPAREMGVVAMKLLLSRIGGDDTPPHTVVLRGEPLPLGTARALAGSDRRDGI